VHNWHIGSIGIVTIVQLQGIGGQRAARQRGITVIIDSYMW
jgi:hypothetical protein